MPLMLIPELACVILVDDHAIVRRGVLDAVSGLGDAVVIAARLGASNGKLQQLLPRRRRSQRFVARPSRDIIAA
jgi:hypothetical protein